MADQCRSVGVRHSSLPPGTQWPGPAERGGRHQWAQRGVNLRVPAEAGSAALVGDSRVPGEISPAGGAGRRNRLDRTAELFGGIRGTVELVGGIRRSDGSHRLPGCRFLGIATATSVDGVLSSF